MFKLNSIFWYQKNQNKKIELALKRKNYQAENLDYNIEYCITVFDRDVQ